MQVEGIKGHPVRQNEHLQANLDFCVPPVQAQVRYLKCINERGDPDVLFVMDVEPSEAVHANARDEVYLRVGDENRRLGFTQRQELLYDKGQASYEARPLPEALLEVLDHDLLDSYAEALGSNDPLRMLQARGLSTGDSLTIAGCLLFADFP